MPVDTTPQMQGLHTHEPAPYTPEALRVRCPHCRKLYLVQFNDIREAKPRFECVQCHNRFWLSLGEMDLTREVTGLPLQVKEVPLPAMKAPPAPKAPASTPTPTSTPSKPIGVQFTGAAQTEACPKCNKLNPVNARECTHCGVMIGKMRAALDFQENVPTHSPMLAAAWKKVVEDYSNENVHQEFLVLAQREYNLPYAAAMFGQMGKLMPSDEITKKRLNEIQAMSTVMLPPRPDRPTPRFGYPRLWQIPLFGAALLILIGIFIPFFRNLVGVGAAFLFLAIAIQIQMRR